MDENQEQRRSGASPRPWVQVPERLEKRLLAYSAAAAGVAALAFVHPAEGEVVYTPANQNILVDENLDLNNDGIVDFKFWHSLHGVGTTGLSRASYYSVGVLAYKSNAIRGIQSALPASVLVGSSQYRNGRCFLARWLYEEFASSKHRKFYFTQDPFSNKPDRYLGLQFVINGQIHYGWARLTILVNAQQRSVTATMTGYAYETVPGAPIFTGRVLPNGAANASPANSSAKPGSKSSATLGHLAQGASGLEVRRGDQSTKPQD